MWDQNHILCEYFRVYYISENFKPESNPKLVRIEYKWIRFTDIRFGPICRAQQRHGWSLVTPCMRVGLWPMRAQRRRSFYRRVQWPFKAVNVGFWAWLASMKNSVIELRKVDVGCGHICFSAPRHWHLGFWHWHRRKNCRRNSTIQSKASNFSQYYHHQNLEDYYTYI